MNINAASPTRFDTALAKAREFMSSGLCAGFAMADADEGPVLCGGARYMEAKNGRGRLLASLAGLHQPPISDHGKQYQRQ